MGMEVAVARYISVALGKNDQAAGAVIGARANLIIAPVSGRGQLVSSY